MQFESGLTKYADHLTPLDLSTIQNNNDIRWNKMKKQDIHSTVVSIEPKKTMKNISVTATTNSVSKMNKLRKKSLSCTTTISSSLSSSSSSSSSSPTSTSHQIQTGPDGLPIDPRDWTRTDVWNWLINMAISEGLDATPDLAQKFPMNGKALCLMSLDMYLSRVPIGGKMLYRDFRVRLARAMSL